MLSNGGDAARSHNSALTQRQLPFDVASCLHAVLTDCHTFKRGCSSAKKPKTQNQKNTHTHTHTPRAPRPTLRAVLCARWQQRGPGTRRSQSDDDFAVLLIGTRNFKPAHCCRGLLGGAFLPAIVEGANALPTLGKGPSWLCSSVFSTCWFPRPPKGSNKWNPPIIP